ncbi:FAD:protein FMN transferase [Prolixibacter sp. SD074]|uniref:FAD:protein FMN transferase n=1 Tax=Prolixibacter sp. SD074 TaxID=2652391 RepID=UPI00188DFD74|nr:FAD:protein FMN transferase [Prolixibacter sp. SD074]
MNLEREICVRSFPAMGTRFDMLILGQSPQVCEMLFHEIRVEVERIEFLFSRFRENGPVGNINQQKHTHWIDISSDELWKAFLDCREYHRKTLGVFDINMGKVSGLWKNNDEAPTKNEEQGCLQFSGMDKMEFDKSGQRIRFLSGKPGIDFGAYGKGYALEKVQKILTAHQVNRAVINFGDSSILTLGKHPSGEYWPMSVRNPVKPGEILHEFEMNNHSLTTSSNRLLADDGWGRVSNHIIHPETGKPVSEGKSVSVLSKSPLNGEILSTAFMFLLPGQYDVVLNEFEYDEVVVVTFGPGASIQKKQFLCNNQTKPNQLL